MKTAVEILEQEFVKLESTIGVHGQIYELLEEAKQIEKSRTIEYAEFCIRCDRAGLPLVQFEDWLNGLTFKSK